MLRKPQKNILIYGLGFLFIAIIVSSIYLIFKPKKNIKTNEFNVGTNSNQENTVKTYYESEMFGYKVDYPRSLTVRELGSGGGYIDFVRFEEGEDANFKGFAVGVSEQTFNNEILRIKKIFDNQNAFLVEETTISINGKPARQLLYKPQTDEEGEERLITIFNNDLYTYSISTIPWQADDVLGRFEFLK